MGRGLIVGFLALVALMSVPSAQAQSHPNLLAPNTFGPVPKLSEFLPRPMYVPKPSEYFPDDFNVPKLSDYLGHNSQGPGSTWNRTFKRIGPLGGGSSGSSSGRRFSFKPFGSLSGN